MNILIGLLIIAVGSFGQSSSYVPIKKVKSWSWESFWLVQGIFAWLVFPLLGASDLFALNPVILLVTLGGFCTNAAYCLWQNIKNRTGREYFSVSVSTGVNNLLFCALAGLLWYSQFFGLGMGKSFFTGSPVMLAFSWSILMSLNVIFSNVWGILLKEWNGVGRRTVTVLIAGLLILIFSTVFPNLVNSNL